MIFNELDINFYKQSWFLCIFIVVAVIQSILASSPIFGYASLLVIFKKLKLYEEGCQYEEFLGTNSTNSSNSTTLNYQPTLTCLQQDRALNLPFAVAIIVQNLVKIPLGNMVDSLGAKPCQYIGCVFLMLFGLSLAYVEADITSLLDDCTLRFTGLTERAYSSKGTEYLLFIAFIFLSISSSFLMLCPYQVVNILYTKNKPFFISLLSGSVDGSTGVFVIFLEIYQTDISFTSICIAYAIGTSCLLMLATTFLYPTKNILQLIVDRDMQARIHPGVIDESGSGKDSLRMRSEDFSANLMSSYNLYHNAIQKSLEQLKEAERREALLASLSQNLAIQMSNQSYDSERKFPSTKPYGTITENVLGFEDDSYGYTGSQSYFNSQDLSEENALIASVDKLLTPYSGGSFKDYAFSKMNIFCTYAFCITLLKVSYFIGNLDKYLTGITDKDTATVYIKYFGYTQFTGIIAAPICSLMFVNNKDVLPASEDFFRKIKQLILPGIVFLLILLLLNVMQLLEMLEVSIPIFGLYLFGNSLMWCYTSLFYAYLFPARYYCSLFGLSIGICGFSTFLQYPILYMEQTVFKGQQFWTNMLFTGLLASTFILPLYLIYYYKTKKPNTGSLAADQEENEKL